MLQPTPYEFHDGLWLLSAKVDEPIDLRPFDAITFSLGDLWAGGASEQRPADRSPARIAKQGTVGREPRSSSAEHRAYRPDFRAGGPVRHSSRTVSSAQGLGECRPLRSCRGTLVKSTTR